LIEALVTAFMLALGLFAANKRHFLLRLEATRLQENQRFMVQFLTRDIRGAGYRGCAEDKGPFFNTLNARVPWRMFSEPVSRTLTMCRRHYRGPWQAPLQVRAGC